MVLPWQERKAGRNRESYRGKKDLYEAAQALHCTGGSLQLQTYQGLSSNNRFFLAGT